MGQALINLFHQKAPRVRFREGFGMTEGGPAITFTRGNLKDTMGSSGQLLPNMRSTFTLYLSIKISTKHGAKFLLIIRNSLVQDEGCQP